MKGFTMLFAAIDPANLKLYLAGALAILALFGPQLAKNPIIASIVEALKKIVVPPTDKPVLKDVTVDVPNSKEMTDLDVHMIVSELIIWFREKKDEKGVLAATELGKHIYDVVYPAK